MPYKTTRPQDAAALADPSPPTAAESALRARNAVVRYLGFSCTPSGREYTMTVSEGLSSRSFVLLITHQAFSSHQVRFQDGPDVCSAKIRQVLAGDFDLVAEAAVEVTAQDLLDYRNAHEPHSSGLRIKLAAKP